MKTAEVGKSYATVTLRSPRRRCDSEKSGTLDKSLSRAQEDLQTPGICLARKCVYVQPRFDASNDTTTVVLKKKILGTAAVEQPMICVCLLAHARPALPWEREALTGIVIPAHPSILCSLVPRSISTPTTRWPPCRLFSLAHSRNDLFNGRWM